MMKLSESKVSLEELMIARLVDSVGFIAWTKTKDAEKGRNRPVSILDALLDREQPKSEFLTFDTPDDFELARQNILKGMNHGN